jgi:energy-coupling factor transport system ATP-binding protein
MENIIEFKDVKFSYPVHDEEIPQVVLKDISLSIKKGEFVVIIGRNGSGKSTMARLINALLIPLEGTVIVKSMDTKEEENLWEIRRTAGMVFQNPDNQIVATSVEEDIAFAPENLGVPPVQIRQRVDEAMKVVGISEFAKHAPHLLSGGQKQRVAIAGIIAMKPQCIIFDESTAMLDPIGRKEVMEVISKLNREEEITIVHITHHMDEAALADRVVVVDNGEILLQGTPKEVFSNVEKIKELGLDVPQTVELFDLLSKSGIKIRHDALTVDEAIEFLEEYIEKSK